MNLSDVEKCIEEIRKNKTDDEVAHSMEDHLRRDVLIAIATGKVDDPVKMAVLALTTQDIKFGRWCS